jgi:RNA polymerase sigma-70 factor, ECF subfamily
VNMTSSSEFNEAAVTVPLIAKVHFDSFYQSSYRRTVAFAFAITSDRGHAEDIAQEAFSAAHRRWAEVSQYDDPGAWVRRVVANKAGNRWRRLGREMRAVTRFAQRPQAVELLEPNDAQFWKAVSSLPRQQAAAIALHYLDDLSVVDIAAQLGCSEGAVKTHLSRARHTLQRRLASHYSPLEAN